ncbi:hypothetical protein Q9966_016661 [Columba livia]|nr:hypothetical protein Q9966_016661 [Columba livia]
MNPPVPALPLLLLLGLGPPPGPRTHPGTPQWLQARVPRVGGNSGGTRATWPARGFPTRTPPTATAHGPSRSPRAKWPRCGSVYLTLNPTPVAGSIRSRCSRDSNPRPRCSAASAARSGRAPCARRGTLCACAWRATEQPGAGLPGLVQRSRPRAQGPPRFVGGRLETPQGTLNTPNWPEENYPPRGHLRLAHRGPPRQGDRAALR